MDYRTSVMKVDQFIGYVNEGKIKMPPFQRGRAWSPKLRADLVQNIVQGRPIPAIFLYREPAGEKYSYNILDGKQRLESLMLFVGDQRRSLKIKNLAKYFFDKKSRSTANFKIKMDGHTRKVGMGDLPEETVRDFRDYNIPIIEITIDDSSGLDEMISLFVDINSHGVKVSRFQIVDAISKDPLLRSGFNVIGIKEKRQHDNHYKFKSNEFTRVLKQLQVVGKLDGKRQQVERAWELIVELFLFLRSRKHRTPGQILSSFVKQSHPGGDRSLSPKEIRELRKIFAFIERAYKNKVLKQSRLATNQIHFYTFVTALIDTDLLDQFDEERLISKLARFGGIVDEATVKAKKPRGKLKEKLDEYLEASSKHTTHPGVRARRQVLFKEAMHLL